MLRALLMLAVLAQEPTVQGPHTPPPQRVAPAGPACTHAVPQQRRYEDAAGDSAAAPDLTALTVDVREDCGVTITFGGLSPEHAFSLGIDTDGDTGSGLRDQAGADRVLGVRELRASLGIVDPATGGVTPVASPTVRAAPSPLSVETTVAALGLHPGRAARLTFSSAGDIAPEAASPGFELTVDFGAVASATQPVLRGTARVGRTLTCAGPAGARYRWLREGRALRGATRRTLQLRRVDVGRRIACRVTVGTASATSRTVRVRR